MSANAKSDKFRLGFLTAVELPKRGYVGGLLVTNRFGRPLEFQCTTPVKPNRTQQILYGPTLAPFILGELLGKTLVEKAGVKPQLILTEQPEILELRQHVSVPVACLKTKETTASSTSEPSPQAEQTSSPSVSLGRQQLCFHDAHPDDRQVVEKSASLVPADADLQEPFERVREALKETTQTTPTRKAG